MALQSLMNQDFGDDDESPDEDFDPDVDGDSGDGDDLPATIEAQYAQNLSRLCTDGDEELLVKLLAEISDNALPGATAGAEAEPNLNVDHLNQHGCTALFTAISHRQLGCCKQLLSAGAATTLLHEGSSYLHAIMALSSIADNRKFALALAKVLFERGTSVTARDAEGRTCLHAAVLGGFLPCIRLTLSQKDCPTILNAKDRNGDTALHLTCTSPNASEILDLLVDLGADVTLQNKHLQTPLHIAYHYRLVPKCISKLKAKGALETAVDYMGQTPSEVLRIPKDQTTLLVCHDICKKHAAPSYKRGRLLLPPENYHRIEVLVEAQKHGILLGHDFSALEWKTDPPRASMSDILRVHEYPYVARIQGICKSLEGSERLFMLDEDTTLSKDSFAAAATAAGAVVLATRRVCRPNLDGEAPCRNAICIVRPPGHHAGPRGQVLCHEGANDDPLEEGWGSHGFCLLNNVAIGAAHARCVLRETISKVAIVDFDVHHGNGTEAIVRNLVPSTYKTNMSLPFGTATVTTPCYKPWKDQTDADNVFFVSVHGFGHKGDGPFYPGTGRTTPVNNVWNIGMGKRCRLRWRSKWRQEILPSLHKFNPDVIFISAGFDAHQTDKYNHEFISLLSNDYKWVTRMLVSVANSCCQGRVVSVLEGGYNVGGEFVSPFAQSVAAHVSALCRTSPDFKWTEEHMQREERFEKDEPARMAAAAAVDPAKRSNVVIEADGSAMPMLKRPRRKRKKVDYRKLLEEDEAYRAVQKKKMTAAAVNNNGGDEDDDDDDYGGLF